MTSATLTHPTTARAFLLDNRDQASVRALAHALDEQGIHAVFGDALQHLTRGGRAEVAKQLASAAQGLLDLDLGKLLIHGWATHADLRAAAERTRAAPGSIEVVELLVHAVRSTHHPWVDVTVDGVPVATVHFEVRLTFVVQGLVATVRGGRLVAFGAGGCQLIGMLAAEGRRLLTQQAQLDLRLVIPLGDGTPLLGTLAPHHQELTDT